MKATLNELPPELEKEIEQSLSIRRMPVPSPITLPRASDDLGRLSAEAVQAQYEAAAKSVEEMGVAVKERITRLESALRECDSDMKLINEAAEMIREKGKLIFAEIEHANSVSQDIRNSVAEFKKRIG